MIDIKIKLKDKHKKPNLLDTNEGSIYSPEYENWEKLKNWVDAKLIIDLLNNNYCIYLKLDKETYFASRKQFYINEQ